MPRRPYFAGAFVVLLGCAVLAGQERLSPEPMAFSEDGSAHWIVMGYTVVPHAQRPPTPEERLARNLQAFAAAVESHQRRFPRQAAPVEFDDEGLDFEIGDIVDDLGDRAQVSVHVRDLASDAVLFDYFGDEPLNPASNQKLVTASAALDLLGDDYTFETRFYVEDDVLFVVGSGDPSLDAAALTEAAARLATTVPVAGMGKIVVDDRAFSSRRFGPGYQRDGVGQAYQAPSGALSLAFNTVQVTVYPITGSRRLGVSVYPENSHVVVDNRARVGGSATRLSVVSEQRGDETVVRVSGRMPRHAPPIVERRRVYDPALYTGTALAAALAQASGTRPLPVEAGVATPTSGPVLVLESPPLLEIVDGGLAWSNNFVAEQLLRTLGWRLTGRPGDWENGNEVLEGYWTALGNDPDALVFINGSGLSGQGRVTTSALVDLISVAHRVQGDQAGLIAALPVAGEEGTLKARLRRSGKRVRAKTGTLRGVSGLSGVIMSEDGTGQVAFSILINVTEGTMPASTRRGAEDEIVMAVLRHLDDYESRRGFLSFEPMWVHGTLSPQPG